MTARILRPVRTLCSLLLLPALAACGADSQNGGEVTPDEAGPRPAATVADERTRYHEVLDPQTGMVQARSPIPESWQVHSLEAPIYISDGEGLKVHKSEQFEFGWSPDPFAQQSIQMLGKTVAPPAPLQQIVEQQIRPSAAAQGYRYLGSYDVPGVEGFWQRHFAAMLQTGSQRSVDALATEWESQSGTRSMIVLVQTVTRQQQMTSWMLQTTEVEAPAGGYEAAKAAYLYAVANTEVNPHWMAAQNQALAGSIRQTTQYWENATEISSRAHEQRMQSIRARGNAALQAGKTYSEILDISHQGYLNRDSINSAGHSAQIDSIRGTTLIGNHETGEHYDVDGNSNYYWVNPDGAYIGTDNSLFDPRLDAITRDEQWTRFHKER